jgi:hypothetical protein
LEPARQKAKVPNMTNFIKQQLISVRNMKMPGSWLVTFSAIDIHMALGKIMQQRK